MEEQLKEEEWTLEFHGVTYVINLSVAGQILVVDVEQLDTGERWSGEFTAQYLEEITQKVEPNTLFGTPSTGFPSLLKISNYPLLTSLPQGWQFQEILCLHKDAFFSLLQKQ
jgi:hypothetical protein